MTLQAARKALATFNVEFTARMERERERQSSALRRAVDEEVWALHDAKWSISKICREYGTKDFRTVKAILDRRVVVTLDAADSEAQITRDGDHLYSITVGDETVEFEWDEESHAAVFFFGKFNANSELVKELRRENNVYAAQIEAIQE